VSITIFNRSVEALPEINDELFSMNENSIDISTDINVIETMKQEVKNLEKEKDVI
jgi:hypothetical protein